MSASEHDNVVQEIIRAFEALAAQIEQAIEVFARDEKASSELAALRRANDAVNRGSELARRLSQRSA